MQFKPLGKSPLLVSNIALGGNVFGWTINEKQSFEVLDAFTDAGFNFIDTADIYCRWATGHGGESETIIGNWLKKKNSRQKVVIATKVGMDMGAGQSGLSKKHILKSVNQSLKRLQTDYIDLYQSHTDDEKTPIEETLDAYAQLIKEGKVRCIGASNFSATRLKQSLDTARQYNLPAYQSLQPHYNLCERLNYEQSLETFCLNNSLSVINYFPLASGFLTGKYRHPQDMNKSVRGSSLGRFMNEKGFAIIKVLEEQAAKHNCNPAAITLAWYLSRPSITAPIASATSTTQLKQLLQATQITLGKSDAEQINACSMY